MFPHEAQELMAKVMFIIFATIMLCMIKLNAADMINTLNYQLKLLPLIRFLNRHSNFQ